MAAGIGSRLRPLTDRWPKPVLPIDGRPVIVTLLHELAAAGVDRFTIVTGHLAEQVEELTAPLPYAIRFVRQDEPDGSAGAVRRASPERSTIVCAADTKFATGDVDRFVSEAGGDGAIAVRRQPGRPEYTRVRIEAGRITRVVDRDGEGEWTGAPLWFLGPPVLAALAGPLGGPPYELAEALQRAIDVGAHVCAIQIGLTRDLTTPEDLVLENVPYLR